jgi:ABC-type Fe3+/spermidine/putrescine transport system ATPase subunit
MSVLDSVEVELLRPSIRGGIGIDCGDACQEKERKMASVDIVHVCKSFGGMEVTHGMSMSIGDGEFVTIVGPSGCGRSTLLSRRARVDRRGQDQDRRPPREPPEPRDRDIAMMF